jgi:excisionase family DNA binding protein
MDEKILEKLNQIERYSLLAAKNVLCLEDVAMLTGLSKSWLYKATCNHLIPFYKPNGKQIYFDRTEIENWMKQNRIATAQEIDQQATSYVVTGRMQKGGKK